VVEHVVLVGPAHYVATSGLVTVSVDALDTPLGTLRVDAEARRVALGLPGVSIDDRAHAPEHSLEVHLPFLQRVLGDVAVLPLLAGQVAADTVAHLFDTLWGGPETLIVVSTDLSHYLDYETALSRDRRTVAAIVDGDSEAIRPEDACGAAGVRGLLLVARARGLHIELLDLRNSGDTAGPRDHVVGYAAFAVTEGAA
jgi:AmmeMemoRadiSam system protein B